MWVKKFRDARAAENAWMREAAHAYGGLCCALGRGQAWGAQPPPQGFLRQTAERKRAGCPAREGRFAGCLAGCPARMPRLRRAIA